MHAPALRLQQQIKDKDRAIQTGAEADASSKIRANALARSRLLLLTRLKCDLELAPPQRALLAWYLALALRCCG